MAIGTPAIVGNNSASGSAATVVITTTVTAPAGQLLLLLWGGDSGAIKTLSGVADQVSNTYTLGTPADQTGAHVRAAWCQNPVSLPSGNTNTSTANTTDSGVILVTVPGTLTPTSFDKQGAGSASSGTAPSIAESAAGLAGRIVFGFITIGTGSADTFTEVLLFIVAGNSF